LQRHEVAWKLRDRVAEGREEELASERIRVVNFNNDERHRGSRLPFDSHAFFKART
jgi:hypothetical protein